jgi:hypothetical protein
MMGYLDPNSYNHTMSRTDRLAGQQNLKNMRILREMGVSGNAGNPSHTDTQRNQQGLTGFENQVKVDTTRLVNEKSFGQQQVGNGVNLLTNNLQRINQLAYTPLSTPMPTQLPSNLAQFSMPSAGAVGGGSDQTMQMVSRLASVIKSTGSSGNPLQMLAQGAAALTGVSIQDAKKIANVAEGLFNGGKVSLAGAAELIGKAFGLNGQAVQLISTAVSLLSNPFTMAAAAGLFAQAAQLLMQCNQTQDQARTQQDQGQAQQLLAQQQQQQAEAIRQRMQQYQGQTQTVMQQIASGQQADAQNLQQMIAQATQLQQLHAKMQQQQQGQQPPQGVDPNAQQAAQQGGWSPQQLQAMQGQVFQQQPQMPFQVQPAVQRQGWPAAAYGNAYTGAVPQASWGQGGGYRPQVAGYTGFSSVPQGIGSYPNLYSAFQPRVNVPSVTVPQFTPPNTGQYRFM